MGNLYKRSRPILSFVRCTPSIATVLGGLSGHDTTPRAERAAEGGRHNAPPLSTRRRYTFIISPALDIEKCIPQIHQRSIGSNRYYYPWYHISSICFEALRYPAACQASLVDGHHAWPYLRYSAPGTGACVASREKRAALFRGWKQRAISSDANARLAVTPGVNSSNTFVSPHFVFQQYFEINKYHHMSLRQSYPGSRRAAHTVIEV